MIFVVSLFYFLMNIQVVPGGGAVESALSVYLEHFAETLVCLCCVILPRDVSHV